MPERGRQLCLQSLRSKALAILRLNDTGNDQSCMMKPASRRGTAAPLGLCRITRCLHSSGIWQAVCLSQALCQVLRTLQWKRPVLTTWHSHCTNHHLAPFSFHPPSPLSAFLDHDHQSSKHETEQRTQTRIYLCNKAGDAQCTFRDLPGNGLPAPGTGCLWQVARLL